MDTLPELPEPSCAPLDSLGESSSRFDDETANRTVAQAAECAHSPRANEECAHSSTFHSAYTEQLFQKLKHLLPARARGRASGDGDAGSPAGARHWPALAVVPGEESSPAVEWTKDMRERLMSDRRQTIAMAKAQAEAVLEASRRARRSRQEEQEREQNRLRTDRGFTVVKVSVTPFPSSLPLFSTAPTYVEEDEDDDADQPPETPASSSPPNSSVQDPLLRVPPEVPELVLDMQFQPDGGEKDARARHGVSAPSSTSGEITLDEAHLPKARSDGEDSASASRPPPSSELSTCSSTPRSGVSPQASSAQAESTPPTAMSSRVAAVSALRSENKPQQQRPRGRPQGLPLHARPQAYTPRVAQGVPYTRSSSSRIHSGDASGLDSKQLGMFHSRTSSDYHSPASSPALRAEDGARRSSFSTLSGSPVPPVTRQPASSPPPAYAVAVGSGARSTPDTAWRTPPAELSPVASPANLLKAVSPPRALAPAACAPVNRAKTTHADRFSAAVAPFERPTARRGSDSGSGFLSESAGADREEVEWMPQVDCRTVADCMPAQVLQEVFNCYMTSLLRRENESVGPTPGGRTRLRAPSNFEACRQLLQDVLLFQHSRNKLGPLDHSATTPASSPPRAVGLAGSFSSPVLTPSPVHMPPSGSRASSPSSSSTSAMGPVAPPGEDSLDEHVRYVTAQRDHGRAERQYCQRRFSGCAFDWDSVLEYGAQPVPLALSAISPMVRRKIEQQRWLALVRDAAGGGGAWAYAFAATTTSNAAVIDRYQQLDGVEQTCPLLCLSPLPRYLHDIYESQRVAPPQPMEPQYSARSRILAVPRSQMSRIARAASNGPASLPQQRQTLLLNTAWRESRLLQWTSLTRHYVEPFFECAASDQEKDSELGNPAARLEGPRLGPMARMRVNQRSLRSASPAEGEGGRPLRLCDAMIRRGRTATRSLSAEPISAVLKRHLQQHESRAQRSTPRRESLPCDPAFNGSSAPAPPEPGRADASSSPPAVASSPVPPPGHTSPPARARTPDARAFRLGVQRERQRGGGAAAAASRTLHSGQTATGCAVELCSNGAPFIVENLAGVCHVFVDEETRLPMEGLSQGWLQSHHESRTKATELSAEGTDASAVLARGLARDRSVRARPLALHLTEAQLPWLARQLTPEEGGLPELQELFCSLDEEKIRRRPGLRSAWTWVKQTLALRDNLLLWSVAPRRSSARRSALASSVAAALRQPAEPIVEEVTALSSRSCSSCSSVSDHDDRCTGETADCVCTQPSSGVQEAPSRALPRGWDLPMMPSGMLLAPPVPLLPPVLPPLYGAATPRGGATCPRAPLPRVGPQLVKRSFLGPAARGRQARKLRFSFRRDAFTGILANPSLQLMDLNGIAFAVLKYVIPLKDLSTRNKKRAKVMSTPLRRPNLRDLYVRVSRNGPDDAPYGPGVLTITPHPLEMALSGTIFPSLEVLWLDAPRIRQLTLGAQHPSLVCLRELHLLLDLTFLSGSLAGLETLPHLQVLHLERILLGDLGFLGQSTSLRELFLHACRVTAQHERTALLGVERAPSLETLSLAYTSDLKDVSSFVSCSTLKRLVLTRCSGISTASLEGLHALPALELLSLEFTRVSSVSAFAASPALHTLRLDGCKRILRASIAGLESSATLRELSLASTNIITVANLADGCCQISSLDLSDCAHLDEAGVQGIRALSNLEILNLSRTALSDLHFLEDCRKLTSLYVEGCVELEPTAFNVLQRVPRLKRLVANRCATITEVGSLLYRCQCLEALSMEYCERFSSDSLLGIERIASLEYLSLSGCSALTSVASLSSGGVRLRVLNLSECQALLPDSLAGLVSLPCLSDLALSGLPQLRDVNVLSHSTTLRRVRLTRCAQLTKDGIKSLLKAGLQVQL